MFTVIGNRLEEINWAHIIMIWIMYNIGEHVTFNK